MNIRLKKEELKTLRQICTLVHELSWDKSVQFRRAHAQGRFALSGLDVLYQEPLISLHSKYTMEDMSLLASKISLQLSKLEDKYESKKTIRK
jgi:hypothetical protein